jgi:Protein of unknown function (DUF3515)
VPAGRHGALTVAAASAICLLLSACGSGRAGGPVIVEVSPPHPDPAAARVCAALGRELPFRLDGHSRRKASPASPLTAAWGDPPVTLRCGVPPPAALGPAAELTVVNGISWFPEPSGSATPSRFTEVGRGTYVEITVPARYAPAGPILVGISDAIAAAVPAKRGAASPRGRGGAGGARRVRR